MIKIIQMNFLFLFVAYCQKCTVCCIINTENEHSSNTEKLSLKKRNGEERLLVEK